MTNRIAIEIGATKLQAAVGTPKGDILDLQKIAVPSGSKADDIRNLVVHLIDRLDKGNTVDRFGIGFGGPVDIAKGSVVQSSQIPGWEGFPLRAWAEKTFNLPCVIENDSNCGALAEALVGAGVGAKVVFYTNLGSGVGGGLVINGSLYKRPLGAAEIGHTRLWDSSVEGYVNVQDLCSGWAIGKIARHRVSEGRMKGLLDLVDGNPENITGEHVGRCATEGDPEAKTFIEETAERFATALCNVVALINPERIVIGGGVSLMGDLFLEPLRKAVAENVFSPLAKNYEIVPSKLGEDVVLVGALVI